jgi:hypothetical protein
MDASLETMIKYSVTVLGELAILAGIVKWGVSEYFKKTTEIELLKEQRVVSQIVDLKTVTDGFKTNLTNFETKLTGMDKMVGEFSIKLQSFSKKQDETSDMVRDSLRKFDNVELVEYRKNHFVLKVPE